MASAQLKKIASTLARLFLIVAALLAALSWGFIYYLDHVVHDGHMHFPMTSRGAFIERPHVVGSGDERAVRWVAAKGCGPGNVQAVTSDYVEDKTFTDWFGGGTPQCEEDGSFNLVCREVIHGRIQESLDKGFDVWYSVHVGCPAHPLYAEFENLVVTRE